MANNLSPDLLAMLQGRLNPTSGSGWTPDVGLGYVTDNGVTYQGLGGQDGGYAAYDPGNTSPGDPFSVYGRDGTFSNEGQFKDMSGLDPLLIAALLAGGGMAAFLPGGFAAGSAASGAAPMIDVAGPGVGSFGVLDPAVTWGMNGADLLAGSGGFTPFSFGVTDPTIPWGTDVSQFSFPAANSITNLPSGTGSLLGPAATALGALSGAQGQDAQQTTKKDLPEYLAPYLTGENGLFGRAAGLLASQMTPEALAGYDQMKTVGRGLLGRTVAPNGASLFGIG